MLERALDRVSGRVSMRIHDRAVRRLPDLAVGLVEVGLARWASNNWHTFDQLEVNCTGQLYRWLKEAQRADEQFHVLDIQIEHVILTPAMMAGLASAASAQRPDLRISVRGAGIHVEAKRLRVGGSWCRNYVHRGMARFVTSSYGSGEPLGLMVGYVQQANANGLLQRVNGFVQGHPAMGSEHQLAATSGNRHGSWHRSTHVRTADVAIQLLHVWVPL